MRGAIVCLLTLIMMRPVYSFESSEWLSCSRAPEECAFKAPNTIAEWRSYRKANVFEVEVEIVPLRDIIFATTRRPTQIHRIYRSLRSLSDDFTDEPGGAIIIGVASMEVSSTPRDIPSSLESHQIIGNEDDISRLIVNTSPNANKAFIFVHGVNNTLETALESGFALSGGFTEVVPIVFSWPSSYWFSFERFPYIIAASTYGLYSYIYDTEIAEFSFKGFNDTIQAISRTKSIGSIDILAHSRGALPVLSGLERLFLSGRDVVGRISSVSLAAPDVSEERFEAAFEEMLSSMQSVITLYTAGESDLALWAAKMATGRRRIGSGELMTDAADIVSVTGDQSFLGHSFFEKVSEFREDLTQIVMFGTRARDRRSVVRIDDGKFMLMRN